MRDDEREVQLFFVGSGHIFFVGSGQDFRRVRPRVFPNLYHQPYRAQPGSGEITGAKNYLGRVALNIWPKFRFYCYFFDFLIFTKK